MSVCYPDNTADDKKAWSLSVNEDAKAPAQTGSGKASFQGSVASFTLPPKQLARSRALSLDSSSARIAYGKRPVYGSAQVYVNREHRELNSGFEVLPAGMLGVRPEIPFNRPGSALDKDERTSSSMRTTKRLYKQRC
ncbi:hypothetical protein QQS21_012356 [Conoideocrella luteorostrata]|uniref:Uncharacterized protein n=1 Tax=Conoideocrella luteorostrata TaxID=1105319 RepID=A0AAJ0FUX9_9HYPO|nr:hypothetical protein QQS21_012356 [Conoideocrella luteorostrata]